MKYPRANDPKPVFGLQSPEYNTDRISCDLRQVLEGAAVFLEGYGVEAEKARRLQGVDPKACRIATARARRQLRRYLHCLYIVEHGLARYGVHDLPGAIARARSIYEALDGAPFTPFLPAIPGDGSVAGRADDIFRQLSAMRLPMEPDEDFFIHDDDDKEEGSASYGS